MRKIVVLLMLVNVLIVGCFSNTGEGNLGKSEVFFEFANVSDVSIDGIPLVIENGVAKKELSIGRHTVKWVYGNSMSKEITIIKSGQLIKLFSDSIDPNNVVKEYAVFDHYYLSSTMGPASRNIIINVDAYDKDNLKMMFNKFDDKNLFYINGFQVKLEHIKFSTPFTETYLDGWDYNTTINGMSDVYFSRDGIKSNTISIELK